jgi:putative acetyltransferase
MEFTTAYKDRTGDIIAMFDKTFTDSEGAEAGQLIKELVADMLANLSDEDMYVFSAIEDGSIVGSIVFTRLSYEQDTRTVFILAPVAVSTSQQGKGLGQRLIAHGLQTLRDNGVDVALTYGDINFYSKVGFKHITEADAQPPLPLQYPEGWLGQSLGEAEFEPLVGPSRCVAPLNDPNHW